MSATDPCVPCPPEMRDCSQILREIYLAQVGGMIGKGTDISGAQLKMASDEGSSLYLSASGNGTSGGLEDYLVPTVGSKDNPMQFISTRLPGEKNPCEYDTEYKILNYIANHLKGRTDESGVLYLYTEKPACDSFSGIIKQFRAMFPNVKFYLEEGSGPWRGPQ